MIKQKFSFKETSKYIFLFIISFFCMAFIQSTESYAASKVTKPELIKPKSGAEITYQNCNKWMKEGQSCKVIVTRKAGAGDKCGTISATLNFTSDTIKSKTVTYTGNANIAGGSSSHCYFDVSVGVSNYDTTPPYFDNPWLQVISGTCDKSKVAGANRGQYITSANTITCVGNVTLKSEQYYDTQSGPSSSYVTKTCSPGTTCSLAGVDKVGNY